MVKLRSLGTPMHHGRRLGIGEIFHASEAEAAEWVAVGMAVRIVESADEEDKKKSYKRRDLRAED